MICSLLTQPRFVEVEPKNSFISISIDDWNRNLKFSDAIGHKVGARVYCHLAPEHHLDTMKVVMCKVSRVWRGDFACNCNTNCEDEYARTHWIWKYACGIWHSIILSNCHSVLIVIDKNRGQRWLKELKCVQNDWRHDKYTTMQIVCVERFSQMDWKTLTHHT